MLDSVAFFDVGPDMYVGIGFSASSKKSKMCGLMKISSGMELRVIQAKRNAFLVVFCRESELLPEPDSLGAFRSVEEKKIVSD